VAIRVLNTSVLYVEDEYIIRTEVQEMLEKRISKIFVAKDGIEGLEMYNKYLPDIIITDIKMPNMNGIEMVKKIRNKNPNIPIIITSGFEKEFDKFTEMNITQYIVKPVDIMKLYLELNAAYDIVKKSRK
jgi:YesN/AraC family two-component response regulator